MSGRVNFSINVDVRENGRKKSGFEVENDLNGEATLADLLNFTKSTLILISNEVLRDEQSRGFEEKPVVLVDNKQNKPLAAVHPLGQIEFLSRSLDIKDLVMETYNGLLRRSPILSGEYIDSHVVMFNNQQIANNANELQSWLAKKPELEQTDKIWFVNTQPYARKLERHGVVAGAEGNKGRRRYATKGKKATKILIPNGAYVQTARAIKSSKNYKANVSVRFTFISGSFLGLSGNFKSGRKGKNSAGRAYLYPAVILSFIEGAKF